MNEKYNLQDNLASNNYNNESYFDYKIEYSDDREIYEERVRSHYIPWPAVCLIGVEKTTTSTEEVMGAE